jgi:hypothetical protein
MAGEERIERGPLSVPRPPTGEDFDLPLPVLAVALLVVLTVSALVFGHGRAAEFVFVAAIWAIAAGLALVRYRRSR